MKNTKSRRNGDKDVLATGGVIESGRSLLRGGDCSSHKGLGTNKAGMDYLVRDMQGQRGSARSVGVA